jgi:hypothetical protein
MEDPKAEELSAAEQAKVDDGTAPVARAASPEEKELADLKAQRAGFLTAPEFIDDEPNPMFIAWRDCDRILAAGTVALIAGVEVRLLKDSPVMAPLFRDEAVFVEHLADSGNRQSFGVNVEHLRNRYNGSGAKIGVNEDHPLNRLDARIAELELEVAAQAQAAAELEATKKAEAAKPLPIEPGPSDKSVTG